MIVDCYVYIAENIRTGKIIEGAATDLAEVIGCSSCTIRKYGLNPGVFQKTWDIKKSDKCKRNNARDDCNSLTEEDLQKWDNFIASIHNKPKSKFRKPQEFYESKRSK